MIQLDAPHPASLCSLLGEPGAFGWWYADLVSPGGDGVVLIWSFGLPFLPARARVSALERPALSLAVYRAGQPVHYVLQEYAAEQASPPGESMRLGQSQLRVEQRAGRAHLRAELDLPVPATSERLTAWLELEGPSAAVTPTGGVLTHAWQPLACAAEGTAEVRYGGQSSALAGSGYVDSNFSRVPLAEQGIRRWSWGRVSFPDRTLVYYDVEPLAAEAYGTPADVPSSGPSGASLFLQRRDGVLEPLADGRVVQARPSRGRFGLRSARELLLEGAEERVEVALTHRVEDGPFYQRFLLTARDARGVEGVGVAEVVDPTRLDVPWQRPLVRMRTHAVGGENSFFLPLFNGPSEDRVRRLLRAPRAAARRAP